MDSNHGKSPGKGSWKKVIECCYKELDPGIKTTPVTYICINVDMFYSPQESRVRRETVA